MLNDQLRARIKTNPRRCGYMRVIYARVTYTLLGEHNYAKIECVRSVPFCKRNAAIQFIKDHGKRVPMCGFRIRWAWCVRALDEATHIVGHPRVNCVTLPL